MEGVIRHEAGRLLQLPSYTCSALRPCQDLLHEAGRLLGTKRWIAAVVCRCGASFTRGSGGVCAVGVQLAGHQLQCNVASSVLTQQS